MASSPGYYGSIPDIAKAYQNDPRNQLIASALADATKGSPVAQGGWAIPDGLAKVAQAIAASVAQKQQNKMYAGREEDYTKTLADSVSKALGAQNPAAGMPSTNPALENGFFNTPAVLNTAALNPAGAPPSAGGDPHAAIAQALAAPPPSPGPQPPPGPLNAPQAASAPPVGPMPGAGPPPFKMPAPPPVPGLGTPHYYEQGIVPIEGGMDPNTGAFRTSPKGAIGPGQIMPSTGPEAARLAGLPYDPNKLHTDPAYNNALGKAYYGKQLSDFNDPVMAAAAYNAGPGRVRRAIRRAGVDGDWVSQLPDETQKYVANFTQRIGSTSSSASPQGQTVIPDANLEAIPNPLQMPTQAPNAPALPSPVHSSRLAIAQEMLKSGNPDLVNIAQSYLDKGLTENLDADKTANEQQFTQGQTGYQSALNDYTGARTDARSDASLTRREIMARNQASRERVAQEQFTAGQNAAERTKDWGITRYTQDQDNSRAALADKGATLRTQMAIEGKHQDAATRQAQQKNAFYGTPTGLKAQQAIMDKVNSIDSQISDTKRFMELQAKQKTGGYILGTSWGQSIAGMTNAEIAEMNALKNKMTVGSLGGSLGVAISDGDRNYLDNTSFSAGKPKAFNDSVAQTRIRALTRAKDQQFAWMDAQADPASLPQFYHQWQQYTNEVSIRSPGDYISFDEWKQYRASHPGKR